MKEIWRTYSPWVTVPPGTIGDPRNRPPHRPYNRCARSPDKRMPTDHLMEIVRSQIRIVVSALRHRPVGTIPESSVSAVDSSDTCRPAVHDRTRPCHSNLWVGNSNLIIVNNGMAITNRETPRDLIHTGLHALHSNHTSSSCITSNSSCSPLDTAINSIILQPSSCTEKCVSTADQDHVKSQEVPPNNVTDRTSVPHTVHRATSPDQNHTKPATRPADFGSGPLVFGVMDW